MRNGDDDNILVVIVSTILSFVPPDHANHHTRSHFTNNSHRLHRFEHHSDEIQESNLKNQQSTS